ncbi:hypothetical protein M973_00855 [Francisella orientalis LADL 07-285A]|nr:hypothetical protein M973_00855 [Francisella orientalis LADL 07-285A]
MVIATPLVAGFAYYHVSTIPALNVTKDFGWANEKY